MTIQEMTICNLIQTFPVLLILAQKHNRCLETQFVYQPPSPTQSPEYYLALEALFQNLYGHGHPSHEPHKPCYTYSKKYGIKPCHGSHEYPEHGYGSYGNSYGSHAPSYGSHTPSYSSHTSSYGSHGPDYGHSYGSPGYGNGAGYGALGSPGYKKGNMYTANVTYGGGYASNQGYSSTSNRYKIVVKKTRIGRTRKKSGKLTEGECSRINLLCLTVGWLSPVKELELFYRSKSFYR